MMQNYKILYIYSILPVGSGASENRLTALLQVVEGDQNRTRAHQRLKTGDLRRPPYLLFGSFMVVVLAYSQFPYRTKEQNTIPEKGPPVWSGKYENRPLQWNRKGIRFLMSLAK